MISAQELRKLQESFIQNKEDDFIPRFKQAVDQYKTILIQESEKAIMAAQNTNLHYIFLDYLPLTKTYEGFYYNTVLYGFWKGEHLFTKHDITSPFDQANKELDRFGYRLENLSDTNKSNRLYIKLTWGNL